ncbi:MAG: ATP synthase F1 subunit epsilon [Candidatus Glassbacteria bacterium]
MAGRTLRLKILSPESTIFEGEVDKVIVTASDGELGVLPGHAPLVCLLGMGELRLTANGRVDYYAVFGGYMRVSGDLVSVLADAAEPQEAIDEKKARDTLTELVKIPPGRRGDEDLAEMTRCRVRLKVKSR